MQRRCRKCGKVCNIKLTKYVKVLLKRKIFMCEVCGDIDDWKNDFTRYPAYGNDFTWNECSVECYDLRLYDWIENKIIKTKEYCEIKMNCGIFYSCFPAALKGDYLICCKDEYSPEVENGMHKRGAVEKRVPLNHIAGIKRLDIYKDYVVPDVAEPVIGFKGLCLKDGILESHKYIYEIGIPYEEQQRNPLYTDFQDVYSHFCLSIEDVLLHRDFISSPLAFSQGKDVCETRLFKIKGEEHCFQNTATGWVSNKLTLIREVSKEEIVDYFNARQELKTFLERYFQESRSIYNNTWEEYVKADIKPYNELMNDNEIEDMLINNCEYRKMGKCPQTTRKPKLNKCEQCNYYSYDMKNKNPSYCYLTARNAIRSGFFDEANPNYQYLLEHNCRTELEAIQRLLKYWRMEN